MNLNLTKMHTQGIPLIEGGALFLSERPSENLITSSALQVRGKHSVQSFNGVIVLIFRTLLHALPKNITTLTVLLKQCLKHL